MENKINILITGGAGFIGSNLIEHFFVDSRIKLVRVLDNLSNGYIENIEKYFTHPKFEFIEGDIRDYNTCLKACEGIDKITHQAALGSVPRSIENPMQSTEVNILGTVNLMYAAVQQNVERVVLAFSSSTYGNNKDLPKKEENIGHPLSPYAVTKSAIEQFAHVFGETYGMTWIGLRYFNVFGPNQNPDNPYAAVIPLFCKAALNNTTLTINGDGTTSRDFTYVDNIVQLNDKALFTNNKKALNQIFNAATGGNINLLEIVKELEKLLNKKLKVEFKSFRVGDVKHSEASIIKAQNFLNYTPNIEFAEGLKKYLYHLIQNK